MNAPASTIVGVVGELRRYPVKSMLGEQLERARLTSRGLAGDRAWGLVDEETGKVVSVKRPRRCGRVFELTATTRARGVEVTFPDGRTWGVDHPDLPTRLSDFFGRSVVVASVPPTGATFEEAWERDLKSGVSPWFDLPSRDDGDDTDLIEGGQFMSEQGTFLNFGAVHLVTTSTTRRLAELAPGSRFDPKRFRPNVVVETEEEGFVETQWQGRTLSIGNATLQVTFTVPRCVMTTLEQDDLPADREVLRTVSQHNPVDCLGAGTAYPCVGVYADVVAEGDVEPGQAVLLG